MRDRRKGDDITWKNGLMRRRSRPSSGVPSRDSFVALTDYCCDEDRVGREANSGFRYERCCRDGGREWPATLLHMSTLSVGRLPNLFFHFLSDLLFIDDDPRAAKVRDFTD